MRTDPPPYDPPYDSPIEDAFAWSLGKYIDRNVAVLKQFEAPTICGQFRIDLVVVTPNGHKVAYECDGADFHDESRDEWRDAMILGAACVDVIVRLRGQDIVHRMDDTLLVASRWDPQIYSERGTHHLNRLASSRARNFDPSDDPCAAVISYPDESKNPANPLHIRLLRRTGVNPPGVLRQFWQAAFRFAQSIGGGNLNDIIQQYRRSTLDGVRIPW